MLTLTAIVMTAMLNPARPAMQMPSTTCLHEAGSETPDQHARKLKALGVARMINSAESGYSAKFGGYGRLNDLVTGTFVNAPPPTGDFVPGFKLQLDPMPTGYWFSVTDTTDPCGFRFISNQDGVIFTAEPIR